MNQSIHEANQREIKLKKIAGLLLFLAGLVIFIVGLLTSSGNFTPPMLFGPVAAVAGMVFFLVNRKKGIAYTRYLEQEANRPKSMAEQLAEQQAREIEEEKLHTGTQDIADDRKGHMGLGVLGAFLGCLLGSLLWAYVMGKGYISVYCGIVMILLSFVGYKLFSLNKGTEGMTASVVMSAVLIPIANYAGFIWLFYNKLAAFRHLTFLEMWRCAWGVMKERELVGEFFRCMWSGYVFMLVAAYVVYRWIRRMTWKI